MIMQVDPDVTLVVGASRNDEGCDTKHDTVWSRGLNMLNIPISSSSDVKYQCVPHFYIIVLVAWGSAWREVAYGD